MTAAFQIKPATRTGIIPLIGLWGGTGGGKTKTALLLARGLAGPNGKVGIVDTEHRRASYYADSIPGSFQHIEFDEPYSPERYLESLELLEQSVDVGVLDSGTHLWEGPDGIIDLHEQALDRMCGERREDWKERERLNWPAWREPKSRYKTVRDKILRFKIPLIVCLRGEQKTRLIKDGGRNTVQTDVDTSPVFDRKFIFEMHIALEVVQKNGEGGFIKFTRPYAKVSHEEIRRLLPDEEKTQLGISHGQALARWCEGTPAGTTSPGSGGGGVPHSTAAPGVPKSMPVSVAALKKELWDMTIHLHHGDKTQIGALEQWLWDEALMDFDHSLGDLNETQLRAVVAATAKKLKK